VQNEPNENYSEPEKFHSIVETSLSLSNIRAHLMSLGEGIEAFDSLKKQDEYLSIYALKQKNQNTHPLCLRMLHNKT
jgi:hypothetical protein